jgi:hypothetical protein
VAQRTVAALGGGQDDSPQFQAAIDALRPTGGVLLVDPSNGPLNPLTHVSADGAVGISIEGPCPAQVIPGDTAPTQVLFGMSGPGPAFTASRSRRLTIKNLAIAATKPDFTGTLVDFTGVPDSAGQTTTWHPTILDSTLSAVGASTRLLDLQYTVVGSFERTNFLGGGAQIIGRRSADTSFSNDMRFVGGMCQGAANGVYPVQGLGDVWSFTGWTWEQSGRGIAGIFSDARINNFRLTSCDAVDSNAPGAFLLLTGVCQGLLVQSCRLYGAGDSIPGWAMELAGQHGVCLLSNSLVAFGSGGISWDTPVAGGFVAGNSFVLGPTAAKVQFHGVNDLTVTYKGNNGFADS